MKQAILPRLSALLVLLALLLGLTTACSPSDLEALAQSVGDAAALMESTASAVDDLADDLNDDTADVPEESAVVSDDTGESGETVVYGSPYYLAEDVALYLHLYRELPPNYLTKDEARDQGWDNSQGNLQEVVPAGCIGGDHFGNYEGLLPEGDWTECDVNYQGGYRNAERLVWNDEGAIYYTGDHYEHFTQLYEAWAEGGAE